AYVQPVTPDLAKAFNLPEQSGALVGGVPAGTPAARAGLKEGDVVTAFNGNKITDHRQLRLMISRMRPNTKGTLELIRIGKKLTLPITLGELPSEKPTRSSTDSHSAVPKGDP